MTISGFTAYVKQLWKNKPDTSTPLSADRLLHIEDGIKGNSDAIAKIAAAVVNQITNDPDKIASMAALYAVNQSVTKLNSDLAGTFSLTEASLYLKRDGRIGAAQVLKNSDASNDYGTNITDYSDVYNTTFNIHNGLATIIRIDASGNTETCSLANQILSGDIQRIEFGHETGADPNVIKHFIAFWHTDGTKSVLSFNNGNIFYDYWDKIQWVNLWTK